MLSTLLIDLSEKKDNILHVILGLNLNNFNLHNIQPTIQTIKEFIL